MAIIILNIFYLAELRTMTDIQNILLECQEYIVIASVIWLLCLDLSILKRAIEVIMPILILDIGIRKYKQIEDGLSIVRLSWRRHKLCLHQ